MSKLIEKAIEQLRGLPEARQDAVAARVLEIIEDTDPWADLPAEVQASQIAAIKEGLAALERGDVVEQSTIDTWVDSLPRKAADRT